jgi:hypothetical protein
MSKASLTADETRYVAQGLRTSLERRGGGRIPPLNQVAVHAVLGRAPSRGVRLRPDQGKARLRLQRSLHRLLNNGITNLRRDSFEELVGWMERYSPGLRGYLRKSVDLAGELGRRRSAQDLPKWFAVATDDELWAFLRPRRVKRRPGTSRPSWGVPRWAIDLFLDFWRDAEAAGIERDVVTLVCRRILAPFCGQDRSGGRLVGWRELTGPALKHALRHSIKAERIWLGLDKNDLRPGTIPLAQRVEPLSEYGWTLDYLERQR